MKANAAVKSVNFMSLRRSTYPSPTWQTLLPAFAVKYETESHNMEVHLLRLRMSDNSGRLRCCCCKVDLASCSMK